MYKSSPPRIVVTGSMLWQMCCMHVTPFHTMSEIFSKRIKGKVRKTHIHIEKLPNSTTKHPNHSMKNCSERTQKIHRKAKVTKKSNTLVLLILSSVRFCVFFRNEK